MKFANAGKLDRKSGVRFGEPGAPVLLPVLLVRPKGKLQTLGFPGFPVKSCGSGQLRVVLFRENHISGAGESCKVGNPGTLGMTKGWVTLPSKVMTKGTAAFRSDQMATDGETGVDGRDGACFDENW